VLGIFVMPSLMGLNNILVNNTISKVIFGQYRLNLVLGSNFCFLKNFFLCLKFLIFPLFEIKRFWPKFIHHFIVTWVGLVFFLQLKVNISEWGTINLQSFFRQTIPNKTVITEFRSFYWNDSFEYCMAKTVVLTYETKWSK